MNRFRWPGMSGTLMRAILWVTVPTLTPCAAQWTWTALAPMPMPVSNNAVVAAVVDGNAYVYSFGGITTGLTSADILRAAFRYDVSADLWEALPDVPDTLGKIASAVSVVGDTAYVIGGYHVFNGPPYELSSDRVHRLDLTTNTWLPDGAPVPIPIDDHVQAVWRDSLILVVTGWSNTTNVPNVQVYDPASDGWQVASPVPNNNLFKAFGACGTIIGDTLVYHGGASLGNNFPARSETRIGVIDPADPLSITWSLAANTPSSPLYRGGCFTHEGRPHFVGGAAVSYNFDANAYNGSGIVPPLARIASFDPVSGMWNEAFGQPEAIMDLRGIGDLDDCRHVIAGGIGANAGVLATTWLLQCGPIGVPEADTEGPRILLDPLAQQLHIRGLPSGPVLVQVFDAAGRSVHTSTRQGPGFQLDVRDLGPGFYAMELSTGTTVSTLRFWSN